MTVIKVSADKTVVVRNPLSINHSLCCNSVLLRLARDNHFLLTPPDSAPSRILRLPCGLPRGRCSNLVRRLQRTSIGGTRPTASAWAPRLSSSHTTPTTSATPVRPPSQFLLRAHLCAARSCVLASVCARAYLITLCNVCCFFVRICATSCGLLHSSRRDRSSLLLGDRVLVVPSRPYSKQKAHEVKTIIKKDPGALPLPHSGAYAQSDVVVSTRC